MIDDEVFMESHSLFQRVLKPGRATVRPFGGGRSGLDAASDAAILTVLSWDLMGAAEFEHGECAKCLVYMYDNRKSLVPTENDGFYFLSIAKVELKAHSLWARVVADPDKLRHSPALQNPEVVGWFDFHNGFFVSRTAEMRDSLHKLLLEMNQ